MGAGYPWRVSVARLTRTHPSTHRRDAPECTTGKKTLTFTLTELTFAITNLTRNTTPGKDGIHNKLLRNLIPECTAALLDYFNHCWTTIGPLNGNMPKSRSFRNQGSQSP